MDGTRDYVDPFAADAAANEGYIYTTNAGLSSRLANRRLTEATLAAHDFTGARVLDMGCGDGTYTRELAEVADLRWVQGIDPAAEAVKVARAGTTRPNVTFAVASAYQSPYGPDTFDVALLRGVLHHMGRPVDALREALRVAPVVVVVEPNGYNPGLKALERFSRYHIEHGEKSYPPRGLDRWVAAVGGRVTTRAFAGFVPMFCPDWWARAAKVVEPAVERVPIVRAVGCAVYVFAAARA
jgi:SAM-dependent methyltransferase